MQELHISVRNLVEFILRGGDIDNRSARMVTDAMLEGGKIHRKIQRSMGENYQAEVPLALTIDAEELLRDGQMELCMECSQQQRHKIQIRYRYHLIRRRKERIRMNQDSILKTSIQNVSIQKTSAQKNSNRYHGLQMNQKISRSRKK